MQPILNVSNIEKYYGNKGMVTKAVDNISFSVNKGEFVGIMGASGSGKTTLLNCISTIDTVTSGHIYVDGKNITTMKSKQLSAFRREQLGFVFQDFNLLDTLTAYENIALALTIIKTPVKQIEAKVNYVAKALGISEILKKYPYQLSGGQKQRVACARAIITQPSLILADEPTGALDTATSRIVMDLFHKLHEEQRKTIVLITHNPELAEETQRVITLRDGRIISVRKGAGIHGRA